MLPARKAHCTCNHTPHTTQPPPHGWRSTCRAGTAGGQCCANSQIVLQTTPGAHQQCCVFIGSKAPIRAQGLRHTASTHNHPVHSVTRQAQPPCADLRSPRDAMCSALGVQASGTLGHMLSMLVVTVATGSRKGDALEATTGKATPPHQPDPLPCSAATAARTLHSLGVHWLPLIGRM
jgi:hypothetical protein